MTDKNKTTNAKPASPPAQATPVAQHPLHIVGIGASAGGLEALEKFFTHMPPESGMAFVVIQHLSPDYKSLMVELLSKHTKMHVLRAEDGMLVETNHVYLIPPKKNMTIFHSHLSLTEKDELSPVNLPIDIFLRSLADDQGEAAVAIILSGTGSDGMRGVRAVKEAGGMVMVQDETSAKFNGMPRSVISTGVADYILPPHEMPAELTGFTQRRADSTADSGQSLLLEEEEPLDSILSFLKHQTGVDFSTYKPSTVNRRIERRLHVNQVQTLNEYLQYLLKSPREVNLLYKEMLIGVTNFFRDREAYALLKDKIIPAVLEDHSDKEPVRVWCAGCSTGEESYSLAMLFMEYLQAHSRHTEIKIFATDIDRGALEQAANGTYPESIAADVSPERLNRFFTKSGDSYRIARSIREMVVFAPHNVCKDPPFTRVDLISCRNLLIYLQNSLQKKILSLFSFSLRPQGYLFLGASESIGDQTDLFKNVDTKWKIYRARSERQANLGGTLLLPQPSAGMTSPPQSPPERSQRPMQGNELLEQICSSLISTLSTICIVVNEHFHLLYVFGDAQEYLSFPSGQASLEIVKLLPRDLSMPLAAALHRGKQEGKEVVYKDVSLHTDSGQKSVTLRVIPGMPIRGLRTFFLVFIEPSQTGEASTIQAEVYDPEEQSEQRINDLEQDLRYTRENLQATIEELETSNEELQATNEELLSSNEELQSTNQELQSVNEELYTVNTEYQNKIEELTNLNNDMTNLLRCTDIGTVFLDLDLCIRRYTPAATHYINLMEQDVGRPLEHLSMNLTYQDLANHARFVIDTREIVVQEVKHRDTSSTLVRIFPYLNEQDTVEGAVVTFIDLSDIRAAKNNLARLEKEKDLILESVSDVILYINKDLGVVWANSASGEVFGIDPEDLVGMEAVRLWQRLDPNLDTKWIKEAVHSGHKRQHELSTTDGTHWLVRSVPVKNDRGKARSVALLGTLLSKET